MGRRLTAGVRTERRSTFFSSSYLSMPTLRAAAGRATALLAILARSVHHVGGRVLRVPGLGLARQAMGRSMERKEKKPVREITRCKTKVSKQAEEKRGKEEKRR